MIFQFRMLHLKVITKFQMHHVWLFLHLRDVLEDSCRVKVSPGEVKREIEKLLASGIHFISSRRVARRSSVFKAKGFNLSKDREAIRFEDPMRREAPRPLQAILPANYKRLGKIQSQTPRCLHPKNSISYFFVPSKYMSVEELFLETGTILTTIDITPQLNVIFPGATYNWISSKIFQRRKLNSIIP